MAHGYEQRNALRINNEGVQTNNCIPHYQLNNETVFARQFRKQNFK
jgi:hypothetical protein